MAARKQKPALFELIGKGPLKPDGTGRLRTPGWFYGRKAAATTTPASPAESAQGLPLPVAPPAGPPPAAGPQIPPVSPKSPLYSAAAAKRQPSLAIRLANQNVQFSASYWVVGLVLLGAILIVLVVFRLGQISVRTDTPAQTETPPARTLDDLTSSEPRPDVLQTTQRSPAPRSQPAEPPSQVSRPATPSPAPPGSSAAPVPPEAGLCLILASHTNQRDLRAVQSYFSTSGLDTRIGRLGQSYVLHSQQTFANMAAARSSQLKDRVAKLGRDYNTKKPETAPRFSPATFESAYWANVDKITGIRD